jgi:A/G-specific adenine glycosylase
MPRPPKEPEGPIVALTPAEAEALSRDLRGWYARSRRQLPWRENPTPWRVWVSEVMLQQTQVDTVIPYFEAFIDRFPTPSALAAASLDEVQTLWSGLGYYRRARMLHAGAVVVATRLDGIVPSDVEGLRAIPGIGPYTAGAIASIAFGKAAPLVDGNVERVLARLTGLTFESDSPAGKRVLWALAGALVSPDDPSAHNQGLMELGALVCTPARPACDRCPWAHPCRARAEGDPTAFPRKRPRKAPASVHAVALALRPHAASPHLLLARRPADGLLGGLWGLPETAYLAPGEPVAPYVSGLLDFLGERLGVPLALGPRLGEVVHVFTHRHLTLALHEATPAEPLPAVVPGPLPPPPDAAEAPTELAWERVPPPPDSVFALSTLARKALALAAGHTLTERQTALTGATGPSSGSAPGSSGHPTKRQKTAPRGRHGSPGLLPLEALFADAPADAPSPGPAQSAPNPRPRAPRRG